MRCMEVILAAQQSYIIVMVDTVPPSRVSTIVANFKREGRATETSANLLDVIQNLHTECFPPHDIQNCGFGTADTRVDFYFFVK